MIQQRRQNLAVSEAVLEDLIGDEEEEIIDNWVSIPPTVDLDQSHEVCVSLRQLQYRRGCSNVLLEDVLQTMQPYLRCLGPRRITDKDKKMQVQKKLFLFIVLSNAFCLLCLLMHFVMVL